jgi:hypothetical protein
MMVFILFRAAVILGGLACLTGLFDRPKFIYREFLVESKKELYILMAPTTRGVPGLMDEKEREGAVACEVYVTGPNDSYSMNTLITLF